MTNQIEHFNPSGANPARGDRLVKEDFLFKLEAIVRALA